MEAIFVNSHVPHVSLITLQISIHGEWIVRLYRMAVCNLELYLNNKQLTKSLGMVDKGFAKGCGSFNWGNLWAVCADISKLKSRLLNMLL